LFSGKWQTHFFTASSSRNRGCQIFLGPNIPKRKNIPNYHKNGRKILQMIIKIPTFYIPRRSKIYPNWYFLVWK
jgi:hypothetical protein